MPYFRASEEKKRHQVTWLGKKFLIPAMAQMNPEGIMMGEISQTHIWVLTRVYVYEGPGVDKTVDKM